MNLISKTVFLASVFLSSFACANELKEVNIEVKLLCPLSDELQNLLDALPKTYNGNENYEEWKQNFVAAMRKTIELVESGKVSGYSWSTSWK
jgi:hypothetical protein